MLHDKYKDDFNCRHCELAYKRVKEWAEKSNIDITYPYIDLLAKRTKSLRIYEMIREAYTLGMARGILMVDNGHNKITLSKATQDLNAENEQLKAELQKLSKDYEAGKNFRKVLQDDLQKSDAENERLRECLNEIKKQISELKTDLCNKCAWQNSDGCDPDGFVCEILINMQNKISEVENES